MLRKNLTRNRIATKTKNAHGALLLREPLSEACASSLDLVEVAKIQVWRRDVWVAAQRKRDLNLTGAVVRHEHRAAGHAERAVSESN